MLKLTHASQLGIALIIATSSLLASCGGSSASDPAPKITYASQVSFGDNNIDAGTYAVGTIAALGGGKYTVNGPSAKLWTELLASTLGLPPPCPAQTGLEGFASQGLNVPVKMNPGCAGYAQGGARVTNPVGLGNKELGGGNAVLGLTTVPVVTQMLNHLKMIGGRFKGNEIVFVSAGQNDIYFQVSTLMAAATSAANAAVSAAVPGQIQKDIASGICVPVDAQASNCVAGALATLRPTVGTATGNSYISENAQKNIDIIATAGRELASHVNNLLVAQGARYVVVVNLPDISKTSYGQNQSAEIKKLLSDMTMAFNTRLAADLSDSAFVIVADQYSRFNDQFSSPAKYGISNIKTPACNLAASVNPFGNSLTCSSKNVIPGDISKYYFADTVHLTPYAHSLAATMITDALKERGWF